MLLSPSTLKGDIVSVLVEAKEPKLVVGETSVKLTPADGEVWMLEAIPVKEAAVDVYNGDDSDVVEFIRHVFNSKHMVYTASPIRQVVEEPNSDHYEFRCMIISTNGYTYIWEYQEEPDRTSIRIYPIIKHV